MDQTDKIAEENRRLRQQNARLQAASQKKSGLPAWLWGIIAVGCGVVGIAFLAILAAVALPMYSTFKQKSKVGSVYQSLQATIPALETWYDDRATFSDIDQVSPSGGAIKAGGLNTGAGLPHVEGCTYGLVSTSGGLGDDICSISISFTWAPNAGCPKSACDGVWTLSCSKSDNRCEVRAVAGDGRLGMNIE